MINPLGWWCIAGETIFDALRRCRVGADPDLVYAELYANATHEYPPEPPELDQ